MMLHPLPLEAESIPSPERFNYPFCYTPHPLCSIAAGEVIDYCYSHEDVYPREGKMFGVLVVGHDGGRGYLRAFSGICNGSYHHAGFVPPVCDLQAPDGYFRNEEAQIEALTDRINSCSDATETAQLKALRKEKSHALQMWTFRQFRMRNPQGESCDLIDIFKDSRTPFTPEEYADYKEGRTALKPRSRIGIPPGGAGECCAPKLLQYAFTHHLRPLCMAEFWVGPSLSDEMRREGYFYPACQAKCRPILNYMLNGLDMDEDPMMDTCRRALDKVRIVYEDDVLMVVYKPSGLLSVPAADIAIPSLLSHLRTTRPTLCMAHRLDMDTSGLILATKSHDVFVCLQEQFFRREVEKKYVAILEDAVPDSPAVSTEGVISLPLSRNPYDRPRQMVDQKYGKKSVTRYRFTSPNRVELYPETGRTHQLRIHCAHSQGLARPIKGDSLYGRAADRLYLHAESITFTHPLTGERMSFSQREL